MPPPLCFSRRRSRSAPDAHQLIPSHSQGSFEIAYTYLLPRLFLHSRTNNLFREGSCYGHMMSFNALFSRPTRQNNWPLKRSHNHLKIRHFERQKRFWAFYFETRFKRFYLTTISLLLLVAKTLAASYF